MIVTDAENVIIKVNQAFTNITGYTAKEAIGQTPQTLAPFRPPGYGFLYSNVG